MFASAAFAVSVLLSTNVLRGRGSCSYNSREELSAEGTSRVTDTSRDRPMKNTPHTSQTNKKRKKPLTSRETRAPGELEAAEVSFSSSLATLKTLSKVGQKQQVKILSCTGLWRLVCESLTNSTLPFSPHRITLPPSALSL